MVSKLLLLTLIFTLIMSVIVVIPFVIPFTYATTTTTTTATPIGVTGGQPKPGTIMNITFENGTTKAIRSDSTNIQAVNGGYFISDPSVQASQPLQSKAISKTVVQQLVSMFVEIRVDEPAISSEGCGEGFGYYVVDPNPSCEPLDKIGQGPPPDQSFCAALGCPYNPPADSEISQQNNNLATTPVTPPGPGELSAAECAAIGCNPGNPISEPVAPQPEPQPEPEPADGNNQNEEEGGNQDEESGDNDGGGGSNEGDSSGGDESEEEE